MITPQSVIKVYSDIYVEGGVCPLAFSNTTRRNTYFNRHLVKTVSAATYVRRDGRVSINMPNNQIDNVNYITFVNPGHENKTYFAVLTSPPIYINDDCYQYTFSLDNFQTYYVCNPNAHLAPFCQIDREHASQSHAETASTALYDDTLWELRTPEALPTSEDLEKIHYNFNFDNQQQTSEFTYDGVAMFDTAVLDSNNQWTPILYLSDIDFDALEATSKWESYKNAAALLYEHGQLTVRIGGSAVTTKKLYNSVNTSITIISPPTSGDYSFQNLLTDLTKWAVTGAIVNIVLLPSNYLDYMYHDANSGFEDIALMPPAVLRGSKYASVDPKLSYYPYTYARVITPAGDVKEYHWEDFSDMANNSVHFAPICDIAEKPSLVIAPKNYKFNRFQNVYDVHAYDVDCLNVIKFDQIPTAPYSIDAYLTQVAAVAQQFVANNTVLVNAQAGVDATQAIANTAGTYAGQALDNGKAMWAGALSGDPISGVEATKDINNMYAAMRAIPKAQENVRTSTADALKGKDDTAFARNLASTRPAFAANQYTPSHGAGFDHFSAYGFINVLGLTVQLRDDILDKYDAYFKIYGYKSGRCGTPFIDNWLHGSSDTTKIPTWKTIATGIKSTYLKISDGEMLGVRQDVSDNLIGWFKQGALIINGDEFND